MDIRKTFKKWAAYQQTVRELAALDNRQLNDLGISRTDINRIARDHASLVYDVLLRRLRPSKPNSRFSM